MRSQGRIFYLLDYVGPTENFHQIRVAGGGRRGRNTIIARSWVTFASNDFQ